MALIPSVRQCDCDKCQTQCAHSFSRICQTLHRLCQLWTICRHAIADTQCTQRGLFPLTLSAIVLKILGFIAEGPIEGPVGATLLQCVQTVTNSVDVCKPWQVVQSYACNRRDLWLHNEWVLRRRNEHLLNIVWAFVWTSPAKKSLNFSCSWNMMIFLHS